MIFILLILVISIVLVVSVYNTYKKKEKLRFYQLFLSIFLVGTLVGLLLYAYLNHF